MTLVAVEMKRGELGKLREIFEKQSKKFDDLNRDDKMKQWTSQIEQYLGNAEDTDEEIELTLKFSEDGEDFTASAVQYVLAEYRRKHPGWFKEKQAA
ncbi:hypothetical protein [Nesterenkonia alba]|uniref:hypothetical protein n=1 Tax=Nesterenkonia alba TaxID=515814 RepID=UPI0003B46650|nr:hypothetical protein [Nesterenkonia alba]